MAMITRWLNVYIDQGSNSPASQWVKLSDVADLNTPTLRILESDRSGSVIMTHNGLNAYGDSEVYLKINLQNGSFRYLSAPLHTPLEVQDVESIEHHLSDRADRNTLPRIGQHTLCVRVRDLVNRLGNNELFLIAQR
jgi:hypothetical protein